MPLSKRQYNIRLKTSPPLVKSREQSIDMVREFLIFDELRDA